MWRATQVSMSTGMWPRSGPEIHVGCVASLERDVGAGVAGAHDEHAAVAEL